MYDVIFTFRSMTAAQRGQYACNIRKISAKLIRTPHGLNDRGCGFAVQVSNEQFDQVLLVFKVDKIDYERVYRQQGSQIREVMV